MATNAPARIVAALALVGAGLGVALALAADRGATSPACGALARQACSPGSLIAAKPFVTGALIGLLLGAAIGIAAALTWREARQLRVGANRPRRAATPQRAVRHERGYVVVPQRIRH